MSHEFRIAVFPGDGIGREVMAPCLTLLEAVTSHGTRVPAAVRIARGRRRALPQTGVALPEATRCAPPRPPTPSCSAPWDSPTSAIPTAPRSRRSSTSAIVSSSTPASGRSACCPACAPRSPIRARTRIDCVLVRESTEGLFAARTESRRDGDDAVLDTMRITRHGSRAAVRVGVRARAPPAPPGARGRGSPASTRPTCCRRWRSSAASSSNAPRAIPTSPPTACTSMPRRCAWCARRGNSTCSSPRTCSATSCRIWAPA